MNSLNKANEMWTCSKCTLDNESDLAPVCEVCQHERDRPPVKVERPPVKVECVITGSKPPTPGLPPPIAVRSEAKLEYAQQGVSIVVCAS